MNNAYRTARLALVLLSGVTIAAGLILTGIACQTTGGKFLRERRGGRRPPIGW